MYLPALARDMYKAQKEVESLELEFENATSVAVQEKVKFKLLQAKAEFSQIKKIMEGEVPSAYIKKLEEMKILFQTLLQPLYDKQYSIIYSKCVRVDEDLSLLTDQEKRITKKVLAGKSYVEIAEILNISINTLKTHMKNIFNKYNVNSKIELYNKLNTRHF